MTEETDERINKLALHAIGKMALGVLGIVTFWAVLLWLMMNF